MSANLLGKLGIAEIHVLSSKYMETLRSSISIQSRYEIFTAPVNFYYLPAAVLQL